MIRDANSSWHGRPMTINDSATADSETRRNQVGGIKIGYSGFVPRAQMHYGSSHYGGLPYRETVKRNLPAPQNRRSSDECGREAWNLERVGHGKQSQVLEAALRAGLKLPSYARATAAAPAQQDRRPASASASAMRTSAPAPAPTAAGNESSRASAPDAGTPLPSFRRMSFTPVSRSHVSPAEDLYYKNHGINTERKGIKPGYMGDNAARRTLAQSPVAYRHCLSSPCSPLATCVRVRALISFAADYARRLCAQGPGALRPDDAWWAARGLDGDGHRWMAAEGEQRRLFGITRGERGVATTTNNNEEWHRVGRV